MTLTLDLETSGLDPWHDKILLIGYRFNATGPVQYIRVYDGEEPNEIFKEALASEVVLKRGHNTHFDLLCLSTAGYKVCGPIDDTRILAYLENPNQELDLKSLTEIKLQRKVVRMEDFGRSRLPNKMIKQHPRLVNNLVKSGNYWVSKRTLEKYNQADVINCDDLRQELISTDWYRKVEQPLSEILFKAEERGIQLDIPYLEELNNEFKNKEEEMLRNFGTLNPASPLQVKEVFKKQGIALQSTDKHQLKQLSWNANLFATRILAFRSISKLRGTYIQPFIDSADINGRIHGRFNQAGRESITSGDVRGTATGRLSSSDPNLQNIPTRTEEGKKIRRSIIATPGMTLIDSDLKQIEPRLIAHYSQSKILLDAYEKGIDTHALMGSLIFNKSIETLTKLERFIGKTSWLATVYGCWYKKLRQIIEINSEEPIYYDNEFYQKVQTAFWQANPEIQNWRERHVNITRNTGHVTTIGERIIKIPGIHSHNEREKNQAERLALNYQIQGSAADIMKLIIVNWEQYEFNQTHLLASIHDEILCEAPTALSKDMADSLNYWMTNTVKLNNVAIEADTKIINSWAEK